jgi:uncharacterized membrane protein
MASLTVWKFPTPFGADAALAKLGALQTQQLITVRDAAVVSREVGHKKPKTRDLHDSTVGGALGGGFWGLLFGLIFFVPFLGLATTRTLRAANDRLRANSRPLVTAALTVGGVALVVNGALGLWG